MQIYNAKILLALMNINFEKNSNAYRTAFLACCMQVFQLPPDSSAIKSELCTYSKYFLLQCSYQQVGSLITCKYCIINL